MESGVARNQIVLYGGVGAEVDVSGRDRADASAPFRVLLDGELVGRAREGGIVVIGVEHGDLHLRDGGLRRSAVVRGGHRQPIPLLQFTIQVAPQIDPAAVREDAEHAVGHVRAVVAYQEPVGDPSVVTGVQVDCGHLQDLRREGRLGKQKC